MLILTEPDKSLIVASHEPVSPTLASLCNFVAETCRRIDSLIHSYTGFFGIDLMISKDSLDVLECNIRLTAATLPTLLANAIGVYRYVEYFEEVPLLSVDTADTVLVRSEYTDSAHIIRPCR